MLSKVENDPVLMLWRGFHASTRQNLTSPNCISKSLSIYHKCSLLGNKFNKHARTHYVGPVAQMPQPGKSDDPNAAKAQTLAFQPNHFCGPTTKPTTTDKAVAHVEDLRAKIAAMEQMKKDA
jgi:hypothetical protein